jgi:hypothetical protein
MQMAVETNQQRKGIGKLLVELSFFAINGIKEIICHARNNAVSFYLNLGLRSMMPLLWKWYSTLSYENSSGRLKGYYNAILMKQLMFSFECL